MNLTITKEVQNEKIIASYNTNNDYKHLSTVCYASSDAGLPSEIKNHPDCAGKAYFMVAYMEETPTTAGTISFSDQMESVNPSGSSNGIVVAYNLYDSMVLETESPGGEIKLGAG